MFAWLIFSGLLLATNAAWSAPDEPQPLLVEQASASVDDATHSKEFGITKLTRVQVLIGSFTIFTLAVIVGFEIIAKVPPTLHTPLMSGSNAISGITVVGALIAAGNQQGGFASLLGLVAVILANINVVGGFWVTHRMLLMFKKK